MSLNSEIIFLIFLIFANPFMAFAAEDPLFTKKMAEDKLVESGYRWRQSFSPMNDADAKMKQAQAPNNAMFYGFSREFVAKTSELMYGLSDKLNNMIGGGITGIEGRYDFLNQAAMSRIKAAEANEKLGKATAMQYQNDLKFLVLLRYLNAQQAQKKSEVVDVMLNKDQELYHLAHEKVRTGVGVPLDLARAEMIVERDKFKKLDADAAYDKALQELKELIVELPANLRLEPLTFKEVPEDIILRLEQKSSDRPEMKVAEFTYKAVSYLKESTDNERALTISLYGEVGLAGTQFLGLQGAASGLVGVQLSFPLFTGGYQQAKSAEMLNKMNDADLQRQQIDLETKSQMKTVKAQLEYARKVMNSSMLQLELAKKELHYAEEKIRIGTSNNMELVNAQTNLAAALELNVQALFAYEAAKLSFFHLIADVDSYFEFEQSKGVSHE